MKVLAGTQWTILRPVIFILALFLMYLILPGSPLSNKTSSIMVTNSTRVSGDDDDDDSNNDDTWCNVACTTGTPCEYNNEVDFRIIVMSYNRNTSLETCLNHVRKIDMMGDQASVHIWLDRSKKGELNPDILATANAFKDSMRGISHLKACVHVQDKHAGIIGQWTDTWRPKPNTKELGLILEDDIDVSPMAYRWIKAVHAHYGHRSDIAGYTLQMENVKFFAGDKGAMKGPPQDNVYMYHVLGTWGFAPHPGNWRMYQTWSHEAHSNTSVKPYVEGIRPTIWYKGFEKHGGVENMWEMWHMYFSHINNFYTIYSNLILFTGQEDTLLSWNRKEPGLHFSKSSARASTNHLLSVWNDSFVQFPSSTVQFTYDGEVERRV